MIGYALISVATLAFGLASHSGNARPPARPPAERPAGDRDGVANYLKQKAEEFADHERGLAGIGKRRDFAPLYKLLKDKGAFGKHQVVGKSAGERAAIRDALTRTAAYYLAGTGTTPSDAKRLARNGYDVPGAVERVIAGGSTLEDDLAVAETPILGRLVDSVESGASERRLTFTVDRNVKGRAGLPEQVSFAVPAFHPVSSVGRGSSCLLLLSDTLGRFRASGGKPRSSTAFQQQLEPYCQEGPVFRRLSSEMSASIPSAEMTAALDRMARANQNISKAGFRRDDGQEGSR